MDGMKEDIDPVETILRENDRRTREINRTFNPISGEGSLGDRIKVHIPDFVIPLQWIPVEMACVPLVRMIVKAGSIAAFLSDCLAVEPEPSEVVKVQRQLIRLRCRYDFPFWAATFVKIKNKEGGDDVLFRLRHPQRILVSRFEKKRKAGMPIRLILLKA